VCMCVCVCVWIHTDTHVLVNVLDYHAQIVFIHGFASCSFIFDPHLKYLVAAGYRVLTFDILLVCVRVCVCVCESMCILLYYSFGIETRIVYVCFIKVVHIRCMCV